MSDNNTTPTGVAAIEARLAEVQAQYAAEVVPGVSDDSVLEAERDTLEWVLSHLSAERDDNMVVSFVGEAYGAFQGMLNDMAGYGITVTRLDGSKVEAVLIGADHDAEDGATVSYFPNAADYDYPTVREIEEHHADKIVSEVVRRIEVA